LGHERGTSTQSAIRTAAIATCLVAAVLTAVLTATDLLVEHNLIDGVDQRLEGRLGTFDAVHLVAPPFRHRSTTTSMSQSWRG